MTRGGGRLALRSCMILLLTFSILAVASPADAGYTLTILTPEDGAVVEGVLTINGTLEIDGSPMPDAVSLEINGTWRDAVDMGGEGGNWSEWALTWKTGNVRNGTTYITAAVRQGFSHTDQVTIGVTIRNELPAVEMVRLNPPSATECDVISMEGRVTALGSATAVTEYIWRSNIDGHIGGPDAITCLLSPGEHTISLRARTDIGTTSPPVTGNVSVVPVEDIAVPGSDLTSSGYDPFSLDVEDIGRGWFLMSGARDPLSKVVPYTGHRITGLVSGDSMVYASFENGSVVALDRYGLSDGLQGEILDSADVLWSVELGRATAGAIALREDVLFIGTNDGYVYAMDAATGAQDAWPTPGSFFYAGNESVTGDGFTFIEDLLIFTSFNSVEAAGTLWVIDIDDGSIVDHLDIGMLPLQRPLPVGDLLLLPVFNLTDGIILVDISRQGDLSYDGTMDIPDYVMGVSAYRGDLVVLTLPSEEGFPGRIRLYDFALQPRKVVDAGLAFYYPAAMDGERVVISGTPSDSYTGGEFPYQYGRGYLLILDTGLGTLGTIEMDGPPSSAPTIIGNSAFASTSNGTLYAVDLSTLEIVQGWPIPYDLYGRSAAVQSLGATPIVRFGSALAFGSFDTVLYTLGGDVLRPIGEIVSIDPPGETGGRLEAYYGTQVHLVGMGSSLASKEITGHRWHSGLEGVMSEEASFSAVLAAGTHIINFTVVDEDNVTSIPVSVTYVVFPNAIPFAAVANLGESTRIEVNDLLILDMSASGDADGDELTWLIVYGDGMTETAYQAEADHVYGAPGIFIVTITPIDEHGVSGESISLEVRVVEAEAEESSTSLFCIVFILVLVFVIVLMAMVYRKTMTRAEPLEEEPPEIPVRAKARPARASATGPAPERGEPERGANVLAGYEDTEVSMDELSTRLDALLAHKKDLEEYLERENRPKR